MFEKELQDLDLKKIEILENIINKFLSSYNYAVIYNYSVTYINSQNEKCFLAANFDSHKNFRQILLKMDLIDISYLDKEIFKAFENLSTLKQLDILLHKDEFNQDMLIFDTTIITMLNKVSYVISNLPSYCNEYEAISILLTFN